MNTKKIGKLLKQLRIEKKLTQQELSDEMSKEFLLTTNVGISGLEKGNSVPTLDQLRFFSKFYNISIDEIVSGEKIKEGNFEEKYFICDREWFFKTKIENENQRIYEIVNDQIKLIKENFKSLLRKYFNHGEFSLMDRNEFDFLLANFIPGTISRLYDHLFDCYTKYKNFDDFYWNVTKEIYLNKTLLFNFGQLADFNSYSDEEKQRIDKSFNNMDDWEKDMALAMIKERQLNYRYDKSNPYSKLNFYKKHNEEFNEEEQLKSTIKYCISQGAKLNKLYFSFVKGFPKELESIDLIEDCYKNAIADIDFSTNENGKRKFYKMKNNEWNRFFNKYSYTLVRPLKEVGYTDEEAFKICSQNKEFPIEVLEKIANKHGISTNDRTKMVLELETKEYALTKSLIEYHNDEELLAQQLKEYENLSKDLENGITTTTRVDYKKIGGGTDEEIRNFCKDQNRQIDKYQEFLKYRDTELTEELIKNIDKLTIKEIFDKYFVFGGFDIYGQY